MRTIDSTAFAKSYRVPSRHLTVNTRCINANMSRVKTGGNSLVVNSKIQLNRERGTQLQMVVSRNGTNQERAKFNGISSSDMNNWRRVQSNKHPNNSYIKHSFLGSRIQTVARSQIKMFAHPGS